ncbi:MAG: hypothetical protein DHS20C13_27950 [Thermodesulfobacteriota bacterium]|nr:MAG: hypothetical protein DHS20C13_27950 [Thermodesulfobacteriota bacterium]
MEIRQATDKDLIRTGGVLGDINIRPANEGDLEKATDRTLGDIALGVGETALTIGSGVIVEPLAGLAGISEGISAAISGDDVLESAAQRIEEVRSGLTLEPKTETGQEVLGVVAKPFQNLSESALQAGELTLDKSGSPALAASVQTLIENSPAVLGLKSPTTKAIADVKKIESNAKELGVDLGAKPADKTLQIKEAAENLSGHRTSKGEPFPDIQAKIKDVKDIARRHRDNLYTQARGAGASVSVRSLEGLNESIRTSLVDFDIETMSIVHKRLTELDQINSLPSNAKVKLNAIDRYRQRLNKNRPAMKNESEAFALDIIKGQVDSHIDDLFNSDMISGSPDAITKWKEARAAHTAYRNNFKEDKVIRKMAEQEATPEEMRQWIFGASLTGARKESGRTVAKLKELIGDNSPEFRALRQDALLDIIEPLLSDTPDFRGFVKRHDLLIRNNKTLVKELFPDSEKSLSALRDFAKTSDSLTPAQINTRLERMGAVYLFGHSIAKQALKVRLAEKAFKAVKGIQNSSRRREAIAKILGYDAAAPILTLKTFGIPAAGQAAERETEQLQKITTPNAL